MRISDVLQKCVRVSLNIFKMSSGRWLVALGILMSNKAANNVKLSQGVKQLENSDNLVIWTCKCAFRDMKYNMHNQVNLLFN